MEKRALNRLVGSIVLITFFGLIFILAWEFGSMDSQIEGPHLLIKDDHTIEQLTIEYRGNRVEKKINTLSEAESRNTRYQVQIPKENESFSFERHRENQIPEERFPSPKKLIAISDIEGDFEFLARFLLKNNVIDKEFNWAYGTGHLVLLGDHFDRGEYVTEVLWLLYKLEQEAEKKGGAVHVILGNHELMAMKGDHRYVHKKYKNLLRQEDIRYKDLFAQNTELGKWLRTKNAIEIIGNTLFVHGGISPQLVEEKISISEANTTIRKDLKDEVIDPDNRQNLIMKMEGPLWYRGLLNENIQSTAIENILEMYEVEQIVIGHTLVDSIEPLHNNKLYPIDVRRINTKGEGLLIDEGVFYKINQDAIKTKL